MKLDIIKLFKHVYYIDKKKYSFLIYEANKLEI